MNVIMSFITTVYLLFTPNNIWFCLTELGSRWLPAILDSVEEHDLIEEKSKSLFDRKSFWIGGSSNEPATPRVLISYLDYIHDQSGENIVYQYFSLS